MKKLKSICTYLGLYILVEHYTNIKIIKISKHFFIDFVFSLVSLTLVLEKNINEDNLFT